MTIQEEIHQELFKLQNELLALDNATKQISFMASTGESIAQGAKLLQENYMLHLKNIEQLITEQVSAEVQKLENVSSKINTEILQIKNDALAKFDEPIQKVSDLTSAVAQHLDTLKLLLTKLEKVDFPTRLDKLDATVAGINQATQNLQARLERVESNIKDDLRDLKETLRIQTLQLNYLKLFITTTAIIALGAFIVGLVK